MIGTHVQKGFKSRDLNQMGDTGKDLVPKWRAIETLGRNRSVYVPGTRDSTRMRGKMWAAQCACTQA